MIKYSTVVDVEKSPYKIGYSDRMMFVGSCFADNIGAKMRECRFNVEVNPFGAMYNPASVAAACRMMSQAEPRVFTEKDLRRHDGLFHSFLHHGRFSDASAERCLEGINAALRTAVEGFGKLSYLLITFGTADVYRLKNGGETVANCHKIPASEFVGERLTVEEIVGEWSALIEGLREGLKIVFSVSPVRHLKDGAHLNRISKAILLLAIQEIVGRFPDRTSYFPAYEIMMDELRDYRFYADDMLHPTAVAVDYVWERFCESYMSDETKAIIKEVEEINRAMNHKVFNSSADSYKMFLEYTRAKVQQLKDKYPQICISV
ncbi:MAG: GSCFA domain-containing protein [Tannerella sp.]|nr:GSCFA domain-containing protein [Tannerella sp.]